MDIDIEALQVLPEAAHEAGLKECNPTCWSTCERYGTVRTGTI